MIKPNWLVILLIGIVFNSPKVVHVYVTLADNGQGIVSSNSKLEDGDDLYHNQYWGALYGVKQYFDKSDNWENIPYYQDSGENEFGHTILKRILFKHKTEDVYLIADAYRGDKKATLATNDVFAALSGHFKSHLILWDDDKTVLGLHGNADLLVYVGHHFFGATDWIDNHYSRDDITRDVILLGCVTDKMCHSISKAKGNPILLTKQFMAPEAYVLENVLEGWIADEVSDNIRLRAAEAYSEYQGCSLSAALGVFTTQCN